jgi:cell division septation protein DedD
MAAERGRGRVREFELEGLGLFIVGGLLLVLLAAAFYVGRWYERRTAPASPAAATESAKPDPLANVETGEPVEAGEDATFFDTLTGDGKEAEPRREARTTPPGEDPPAATPAATPPATVPADGEHYVQVFAGRLRESAEKLVRELEGKGFPVRIVPVADGRDRLFKVQVGGYATRESAQQVAEKLKDDGYPTAFVTSG